MEHVLLLSPLSFYSKYMLWCVWGHAIVLKEHIQTADFLQKLKEFIVSPVWIHCASENEWLKLKAIHCSHGQYLHFDFFLKLSVQVEQRQKCVLVLLWKCKIIVFIYHLNQQRNLTPTWLRGQDFDRSSSKNQRELHLKGQYYSEYCIHYICQRWEQNTGSMTITPWVYLLVNWWVPHRCKAVIWEVSEKRNTRKEAHFTGLIRL